MNRIESFAKLAGVLICLIFISLPESYTMVQFSLFVIILLSIGIPHGAIDHLISNPKIDKNSLGKFLVIYLSLIAVYLLIWYFLPLIALAAFLLMSAYHFGQSHFLAEQPKKSAWLLYITRGGYFLFAILLGDWETTKLILSPLINLDYLNQSRILILLVFLFSTLLAQGIFGPKFQKLQVLELVLLVPIFYFSPLLISFVVYFGFWHALPSMLAEYSYLSTFKSYNSIKKFSIQLLPFSLISFIGIGLILFLGLKFLKSNELILLFFVLISLISFPHILFMDRFLKNQN
jgi:Brp/Blh family beta-carotene 15,15'-monooxygenase